jgi:hypothetical protein
LDAAVFQKVGFDPGSFDGNAIAELLERDVVASGTLGGSAGGEVREIALQGKKAVMLFEEVAGDTARLVGILIAEGAPELEGRPGRE